MNIVPKFIRSREFREMLGNMSDHQFQWLRAHDEEFPQPRALYEDGKAVWVEAVAIAYAQKVRERLGVCDAAE